MFYDCPNLVVADFHGWKLPKLFVLTRMFYNDRLRKSSGIDCGFKHIQAVGKDTKYTEKQLLRLYNHATKKSPMEFYVMYNGKKPHFSKDMTIK